MADPYLGGINDQSIATLLAGCTNLERLELCKTPDITPATLETLVQRLSAGHLPKLREVVLSEIPALEQDDAGPQQKERLAELLGHGFYCSAKPAAASAAAAPAADATEAVATVARAIPRQLTLKDLWR